MNPGTILGTGPLYRHILLSSPFLCLSFLICERKGPNQTSLLEVIILLMTECLYAVQNLTA